MRNSCTSQCKLLSTFHFHCTALSDQDIKCLWQSQNLLGVFLQSVYRKWKPAFKVLISVKITKFIGLFWSHICDSLSLKILSIHTYVIVVRILFLNLHIFYSVHCNYSKSLKMSFKWQRREVRDLLCVRKN